MLLVPVLAVVTLSLSDSSVANLRSEAQGDGAALDLHNVPNARASIAGKRTELSLHYTPDFALIDVTRDSEFALLHRAGVAQSWWSKRLRLTLAVEGAIGEESYLTAAVPPAVGVPVPAGPDPVPDPQPGGTPPADIAILPGVDVITKAFLGATFSLGYRLSRRWMLTGAVGYEVSGGLGEFERYVPFRRGPTASVGASHSLTKRDELTTSVSAVLADLPKRDARYFTLGALETWQHRFARMTTLTVGAGGTYLWSRPEGGGEKERSLLAAGLVTFSQGYALDASTLLGFSATGSLAATYNPVVGAITQQASGSVTSSISRDRTTLTGSVQVSQSLPVDDPAATRTYGGAVNASYRLADPISLQIGGAWAHQVLPNTLAVDDETDQWSAFAQIDLFAPPAVF